MYTIEKYTIEKCKEKIAEKNYATKNEEEIQKKYDEFKQKFSAKVLKDIPDDELLNYVFLDKANNDDSMCYNLEYKLDGERFGSCNGNADKNYSVSIIYGTRTWRAFPYENDKITGGIAVAETDEHALAVGKLTIKFFIEACGIIDKYISEDKLTSKEGYAELLKEIKQLNNYKFIYNRLYFCKYLHMCYPKYFGSFYTKDFQEKVFDRVQDSKYEYFGDKDRILNMGEIALIAKELGMTTSQFQVFATKEFKLGDDSSNSNNSSNMADNSNDNRADNAVDNMDEHRNEGETVMKKNYPLNTILYGPPGTGKTYHTVEMAYDIINGINNKKYKEKHNWFKAEIKEEKSRVAFVTFHQSYSYEEFIEGIRPIIHDKKETAAENIGTQSASEAAATSETENNNTASVGNVEYELKPGVFKAFCDNARGKEGRFVFIIDEINRGNISKIFGELITLIEETKREGAAEAMSAKLPYSGKSFSVPKNVYIVGTMNTADRSIAMIDTALRRRFRFEEMMPKKSLLDDIDVNGIDVANLLDTINKRIEYLYDREHKIGHSFFMKLIGAEDKKAMLCEIFVNDIIPLLQEYFYEDYKKIALVLGSSDGNGFVETDNNTLKNIFGKGADITDLESDEKIYKLRELDENEKVFDYIKSILDKAETQTAEGGGDEQGNPQPEAEDQPSGDDEQ